MEKHTCCGDVTVKMMAFYRTRVCGKTAKYERDGKWYCGVHDPEAIKAKHDKRRAKLNARWDEQRKCIKDRVTAFKALAWMRENAPEKLAEIEGGK